MTNINITRTDTGLDSKRIEKIISNIESRIQDIKYDRNDVLRIRRKELKEEYIKAHNLQPHFDAIKEVNDEVSVLEEQIKEIKKKADPHKAAIAELFRGDRESTYSYGDVRDGSPADEYITSNLPNLKSIKNKLEELFKEIEEKLWLAKDIVEARELHAYALKQIKVLTEGL